MSLAWLSPEDSSQVLSYLEERFGIPQHALAEHRLFRRGEHVCALHHSAADAADALASVQAGLRLLKVSQSGGYKPSTRGMQVFGALATRNVTELSAEELRAILQGRSLPCPGFRGFVLLRVGKAVIGIGLVRDEQLVSQIPRGMTEYLRLGS